VGKSCRAAEPVEVVAIPVGVVKKPIKVSDPSRFITALDGSSTEG
jgi:hypothetical protein